MDAKWDVDPSTCLDAALVATLSDPLGGFAGQSLVGVPDASGSAFVDVEFDWFDNYPGYVRADVAYQSDVPVNQMRVERNVVNPSYILANLRLGATMGNYDVALYVKNLTNEDANLSFFNNFQQENRVTPSQPRTIGLTFDARF
jgi:outer membrane receptor protein involved in Fe transport